MAVRRQFVVFKIGEEEFAVDIMLAKEVVLMREITPVPETRPYVEGVMNLRGSLVPVLDLRKRLHADKAGFSPNSRIIVAGLEGVTAGLIVDGASEVIRVSDDTIEAAPTLIHEMGATYVEGVINLNNRFITMIDLNKALSGDVVRQLGEVMMVLSRRRQPMPAQQAS